MTYRRAALVSLCAVFARSAHAQPPPTQTDDKQSEHWSTKRFLVETLAGEVVGGIASALTFSAACDGTDCTGSAIASFGVNIAITPLAVWGVGKAMGGAGSLGYSYLGASIALAPFSVTGSADETPADALSRVEIEVAVSSILLAPCSALMYELTSQVRWTRDHAVGLAVHPLHDHDGLSGAVGVITARW